MSGDRLPGRRANASRAPIRSIIVGANCADEFMIDVLDVTKEELAEDIRDNANHIMGSAMFQRMYVGEYDRFGGVPFSSMIGLFEFECHFAHYAPGAFYRRHLDQFAGGGRRRVSTVLYLNSGWRDGDGGELRLYPTPAATTNATRKE